MCWANSPSLRPRARTTTPKRIVSRSFLRRGRSNHRRWRRSAGRFCRFRPSRTQAEAARIAQHARGEVVDDLRFRRCHFQQSSVQDFLSLIRQFECDLLPDTSLRTLTFKSQILGLQAFILQLENIPATIDQLRFGNTADCHRPHELINYFSWKSRLFQAVLAEESDVTAFKQALRIFALRSCHGSKIGRATL